MRYNKLLAAVLSLTILAAPLSGLAAYTVDDIDYSEELSQIEELMSQCDEKGISYDYETVSYTTIKRFADYLIQDINEGVSDDITSYNVSAMDKLCEETIANLTAYINGSKTPKEVTLPDMNDVKVSGTNLVNDSESVYSVGYVSGLNSIDDIPYLNDFGANNYTLEPGLTTFTDFSIPFEIEDHNTSSTVWFDTLTYKNGNYSMKIINPENNLGNVYYRLKQTVPCKPNTTYKFGTSAKITSNDTGEKGLNVVLRANDWSNYISIPESDDWKDYESSFTTAADQTSMIFNILVEGASVCWFDDMFVYEDGTTDNLLKNGDFEGTNTAAPFTAENHSTNYSVTYSNSVVKNGKYALKVINATDETGNIYIRLNHWMPCEPNTTYEFGGYAKVIKTGEGNLTVAARGNNWSNHASVVVDGEWHAYSGEFTTGAEQTSLNYNFLIEGAADCYLDDMYVRVKGTNENLLVNGDLEGGSKLSRIQKIIQGLNLAKTHNVAISILPSPQAFPKNIADVEYYNANGMIQFNINSEAALKIVENHLRELIPIIKEFPAVQNICMTNEPEFRTSNYKDFYYDSFIAYLQSIHGTSIKILNTDYGLSDGFLGFGKTSYDAWSDVSMPDPESFTSSSNITPIFYDWIEFNDNTLADWHVWMADIVKEYTDIPLSTKVMATLRWDGESPTREELTRGTDLELLDAASDMSGNDIYDCYNNPWGYWTGMMNYDYQYSVTDKPLYNSETHIIVDGNAAEASRTAYDETTAANVRNHLWMSAAHGVSMHSIWIWAHVNNLSLMSSQSILTRPDALTQAGQTHLDMMRLSDSLTELKNEQPKIAMFYSKPSRLYNTFHMLSTFKTYQAIMNAGLKVGFVTEKSLNKLNEYDALVLADVTNATQEAVDAVEDFLTNGGKVLTIGAAMTKNEYNVSQSNSIQSNVNCTTEDINVNENYRAYSFTASDTIVRAVNNFVANNNLSRVTLKDADGNMPTMLDWSYTLDASGNLMINITNIDYDNFGTAKDINVYVDGIQITEMKDMISGTENITTASIESFTPQLLSGNVYKAPSEIIDVWVDFDNSKLVWDITNGIYSGAEVYRLVSGDNYELIASTNKTEYEYTEAGVYVVKLMSDTTECKNCKQLYAAFDDTFVLALSDVTNTSTSVSAKVTAINTAKNIVHGVVKFEILTSDGEVYLWHYQTKNLKAGKSNTFAVSLPIFDEVASVRVTAVDSKTANNMIAMEVNKEF